ncbi:hypothetical protein [uncultured Brachyspira sp.]|uniref:hypothetical protein n=1 Tax=uncultured Brachyspira sp. TaxID=221953 RepID=UPI0025E2C03E|nr:hypothetical protein [uncultured Brachyspira sp.]
MDIFNIYKDDIYIKINFLFFKITIKNNKNMIKKLEKDIKCLNNKIESLRDKSSLILNDLRKLIKEKKLQNSLKINNIIFLDTDIEISKYMTKYFPNSKIIKIDFHFNIYNNTVNDFIDILSSNIIVASSESTVFKYLFDDQTIINIWHACGAFKKFGKYSNSKIYELYSSKNNI